MSYNRTWAKLHARVTFLFFYSILFIHFYFFVRFGVSVTSLKLKTRCREIPLAEERARSDRRYTEIRNETRTEHRRSNQNLMSLEI